MVDLDLDLLKFSNFMLQGFIQKTMQVLSMYISEKHATKLTFFPNLGLCEVETHLFPTTEFHL